MRTLIACFFIFLCSVPHLAVSATPVAELSLFGARGTLATDNVPAPLRGYVAHWQGVLERQKSYDKESMEAFLPKPTLQQWKNLVAKFPKMDQAEQLRNVNGFFNRWAQRTDAQLYGEEEHWACAGEFLSKGGGDCEDFAIIKYIALRDLGWPASKLWVLAVYDVSRKQGHAVLAAQVKDSFFILDNVSRPTYLILDHTSLVALYLPEIALNEEGSWVFPPVQKPLLQKKP